MTMWLLQHGHGGRVSSSSSKVSSSGGDATASMAVFITLGILPDGTKEILGIWFDQTPMI
jgi:transposase-like protein